MYNSISVYSFNRVCNQKRLYFVHARPLSDRQTGRRRGVVTGGDPLKRNDKTGNDHVSFIRVCTVHIVHNITCISANRHSKKPHKYIDRTAAAAAPAVVMYTYTVEICILLYTLLKSIKILSSFSRENPIRLHCTFALIFPRVFVFNEKSATGKKTLISTYHPIRVWAI